MKSSICQTCYCFDCDWHEHFKPVDGWTAIHCTIREHDGLLVDSYCVTECPMYKERSDNEFKRINAYDLAPMLGMGHKALVDAVRKDKNAVMEKLRQIGYEGKFELRNKNYSYFIRRIGNATVSTQYIGKKGRSRPIIQLNKQNEVIAEFASIKEASQKTGINYNHIVNQLHGVVHNGNFEWRYKENR